jgi:hypothetical protein
MSDDGIVPGSDIMADLCLSFPAESAYRRQRRKTMALKL